MTFPQRPQALIFDLDGTLFQSETLFLPAYHRTFDQLREEGLFNKDTPPEKRILGALGMLLEDIWKTVIPGESKALYDRANDLLLEKQVDELGKGTGSLYPGVLDGIRLLHERGFRLFVASNGMEQYVKQVAHAKGLAPYFEGLYSADEFKTQSKVDLVARLLRDYQVESAWMVGDRASDVQAGKGNDLYMVGCDYSGFGHGAELEHADTVITSFSDLIGLL